MIPTFIPLLISLTTGLVAQSTPVALTPDVALNLFFQNLDDRIRTASCDEEKGLSFKGKPVRVLLAHRMAKTTFAVECDKEPVQLAGQEAWVCVLQFDWKGPVGGPLAFYISKDKRRYLRDHLTCEG
jgi:hypothetical protein